MPNSKGHHANLQVAMSGFGRTPQARSLVPEICMTHFQSSGKAVFPKLRGDNIDPRMLGFLLSGQTTSIYGSSKIGPRWDE